MSKFTRDLKYRFQLLVLTTISKKGAWSIIGTLLLIYKFIDQSTWMLFVGAMVGISTYEKAKNLFPKFPQDSDMLKKSKETDDSED